MSQNPETVSLGFDNYLFILRRQWRFIALVTIAGLAVAAAAILLIPRTVTATTEVNINVISTEPFNNQKSASGLLDDATEARIATSYVVASRASELLNGNVSSLNIRESSEVVTNSGTSILRVDFTAPDRSTAVAGANAVAAAYMEYRSDQADERINVIVSDINERLDGLQARLEEVNSRTPKAPASGVESKQAESDRLQISIELEHLLSQRNTLESVDTAGGAVLTPADKNPVETTPSKRVILATGLLAGIALGGLLVFLVDRRDFRVRSGVELERLMGTPVLAQLSASNNRVPASGSAADELRVARERVFAELQPKDRGLLIVDDSAGKTISSAAVNFAIAAAQAERRITLILPGIFDHQLEELNTALLLIPGPANDGHAKSFKSEFVPFLSIMVPTDTEDPAQSDLLITRQVRRTVANPDREMHYILAMKSDVHHSSILAGLRLVDNLIVIGQARHSRSDQIRAILDEAAALEVPALGSLMLSDARQ